MVNVLVLIPNATPTAIPSSLPRTLGEAPEKPSELAGEPAREMPTVSRLMAVFPISWLEFSLSPNSFHGPVEYKKRCVVNDCSCLCIHVVIDGAS